MTVIACDGKTMAADSLMTMGSDIAAVSCKKLYRVGDSVVGFAGAIGIAHAVLEWLSIVYLTQDDPGEYPDKNGEALILIMHPNGQVNIMDSAGHEFPAGKPAAIGTGGTVAMTAMLCGKSVKEAVKMATKYDAFCGGKIRSKKCR